MVSRLLMAEHENRGVQAYRWWLALGQAAVIAILLWIGTTLIEQGKDITSLKVQVSLFNARVDGHTDRLRSLDEKNIQQDNRVDKLSERLDELVRQFYRGFRQGQGQP